jgi:hypothetical protein
MTRTRSRNRIGKLEARSLGLLLLALWLIATALVVLLNLSAPGLNVVLGVLQIAAGLFLLMRMEGRRPNYLSWLLLSLWLIVAGLVAVAGLNVAGLGTILALLALGAGIALLAMVRRPGEVGPDLGLLLLAAWLILQALMTLLSLSFPQSGLILALLALAAGALILTRR